ncbi:MAG TPA: hypothetical protein VJR92_04320 [Gemmatimonadaceae bacterium]|nr:hypothetical protein [Gemmatimonadaceae bacterium]
MGKELQFPDVTPDPRVVAALEPVLAPAQDTPAYWDGLHRRIMARVADAGAIAWWSISPAAARAGLVAAGLAILALGALALQTRELNNRLAVDAMAETELEVARVIPGIDEPLAVPARR